MFLIEQLCVERFNVHKASDLMQIEVHTAEPLVPESSSFDVDVAIAKFKKYKSPGCNQIPAELIQAGGGIITGTDP
jgi:hypothetical protein